MGGVGGGEGKGGGNASLSGWARLAAWLPRTYQPADRSACRFVGYYVSDRVSTPPEHQEQYTEKLLLLPAFYLCNDLASSLPDFWRQPPPPHITRKRHQLSSRDVGSIAVCCV